MKKHTVKATAFFLMLLLSFCFCGCSEEKVEETMTGKVNQYVVANEATVNDRYKGDYHLSPPIGWMNDPNGFVYYKGQYHVFWQWHPYSAEWGPMYWGHAVSDDLVSWRYLPAAIAPDREYDCDGCWSGSAIVVGDRLYLIYTGHYERNGKRVQTQCMAYSDDGVSFTKYDKNPLIGADNIPAGTSIVDFRDPYVWKEGDRYYMLVGTMETGAAKVLLYTSENLFDWTFLNNLLRRTGAGYCWECPSLVSVSGVDLFTCSPVDYPHKGYEFCNYNSDVYAVGRVDYTAGVMTAGDFAEIDRGLDFYASQAISGADGKVVMTAWLNMWGRTMVTANLGDGWQGSLCLPRELSVKEGKLIQKPVAALEKYCKNTVTRTVSVSGRREIEGVGGRCVRLKLSVDMTNAESFRLSVLADENNETTVSYDKTRNLLKLSRAKNKYLITADTRDASGGQNRFAEYALQNNVLTMEVYLDKSSVEIFFGEGELTMSALTYNAETADGIYFEANGTATVTVEKSDVVIGGKNG